MNKSVEEQMKYAAETLESATNNIIAAEALNFQEEYEKSKAVSALATAQSQAAMTMLQRAHTIQAVEYMNMQLKHSDYHVRMDAIRSALGAESSLVINLGKQLDPPLPNEVLASS